MFIKILGQNTIPSKGDLLKTQRIKEQINATITSPAALTIHQSEKIIATLYVMALIVI